MTKKLLSEVTPVRQASRRLVRELGVLQASGRGQHISYAQGHVMLELEKHGPLTASELGRILLLNKSSTCRTLQQLHKKNWVRKVDNCPDPRKKPFELTRQGRARLKEMHKEVNDRVHDALALLPKSDRQIIIKGIELYVDALKGSRGPGSNSE
jgi:DNA-binding MarR family transcriptional regulator